MPEKTGSLDLDTIPSSEPSCEEKLSMREEVDRVLEAMKALTPEAARLFLWVKVGELRLAEAAEKVGLSRGAASRLLYRTKRFLRSRLASAESRKNVN